MVARDAPACPLERDLSAELVIERLRAEGPVSVRVWGRSMLPTVRPGARLAFEPCRVEDVRVGDVALLAGPRGVVAHRVVAVGPEHLLTWGDGLPQPDAPWPASALLGRAPGLVLGRGQLPLPRELARPVHVLVGVAARRITRVRAGLAGSALRAPILRALDVARPLRRRLQPFELSPLERGGRGRLAELELRAGRRPAAEALADWRAALDEGGAACLARRGEHVVGWLRAVPRGAGAWELSLWVEAAHRRLGVASALLARTQALARAQRIERLLVRVVVGRPSVAFWRRRGFLPRPDDAAILEREFG